MTDLTQEYGTQDHIAQEHATQEHVTEEFVTQECVTLEDMTQENPAPERTPLIIADEINQINHHSGNILLINAIEIGRRLKEAKNLVKYGEWGRWLSESVRYSARSAARLIRLYEEYGRTGTLSADAETCPISAALSDLTYTNALILMDLPSEQRQTFAADNNIANMSSRQLKQAVDSVIAAGAGGHESRGSEFRGNESGGSERGKPALTNGFNEALQKINDLQGVLTVMVSMIAGLTHQVQSLEQRVEELTAKLLSGKASGSSRKKRGKCSEVVSLPATSIVQADQANKTVPTNQTTLINPVNQTNHSNHTSHTSHTNHTSLTDPTDPSTQSTQASTESNPTPQSADSAANAVSAEGVQSAASDSPAACTSASFTDASTHSDSASSEYPKCTFSGFTNADADYYVREGDSLFKRHVKDMVKAFDQLLILLNALAKKDKNKKEVLRKQLKKTLENMSKTMDRWPPPIRIR